MNPELLSRAQAGDIEARNAIAEELLPSIEIEAKKIAIKRGLDSCDLLSAGFVGLTRAIELFDPSNGARFRTYAQHRIRGAMLDQLRAESFVKRRAAKKGFGVFVTEAPENQVPAQLDAKAERLAENKDAADDALWRMTARERRFVCLHRKHGVTLAEIGVAFGLSESRVCQIVAMGERKALGGPKISHRPGTFIAGNPNPKTPSFAQKQRAAARGHNMTHTPFGYRRIFKSLFVHKAEATAVREVFRRYNSPEYSTLDIAEWLNGQGCKTRTGRTWSRISIVGVIKNPVYAGVTVYSGRRYRGRHVPIVSDEVFDRAQINRLARRNYGPEAVVV